MADRRIRLWLALFCLVDGLDTGERDASATPKFFANLPGLGPLYSGFLKQNEIGYVAMDDGLGRTSLTCKPEAVFAWFIKVYSRRRAPVGAMLAIYRYQIEHADRPGRGQCRRRRSTVAEKMKK